MTNERRLVACALVPISKPPPPPRWHGRWAQVIAFQAGMIGVLALRHAPAVPEPRVEPAATVVPAAPPPPAVPSPPRAGVVAVAARSASPTVAARPRPAAPEPDRLVEVELVSDPPGATVRFGEQIGGTTPLSAFLPASATTIHFELEGYASYTTRWSPRAGRRVAAVLKPAL